VRLKDAFLYQFRISLEHYTQHLPITRPPR
jgi:hypothetical protein